MTTIFGKLWYYVQLIYVEPIGFLVFMAFMMIITVSPQAEKYRMLEEYDTKLWSTKEDQDMIVQDKIILWDMINYACNIPIAMVCMTYWSSLSDRVGRQTNMLLGLASFEIMMLGPLLVYHNRLQAPLWVKPLGTAISATMGDFFLTYIAAQAFLADTNPHKETLTLRINAVSIVRQVGMLFGAVLAGTLAGYGFGFCMIVGMGLGVVAFFYTLVRVPQIPPKMLERKQRRMTLEGGDESDFDLWDAYKHTEEERKKEEGMKAKIKEKLHLFKETLDTFAKKRHGHKRFFIISIAILQFVTGLSAQEAGRLVSVYTLNKPLYWGPEELAVFNFSNIAMGLIGSFGGILIFKKVLHLRDTTVIIIGLVSQTLHTIPIAFATQMWHMLLSTVLGMFGGLTSPTLGSFVASLVPLDEIGKVYTAFAMTQFVAAIIQQYVLQQIYRMTIESWRGFMWIFCSVLTGCCVVDMFIIHFMSKRENVGETIPALNEHSFSSSTASESDVGRH